MEIHVDPNWRKVDEEAFTDYLKESPDYRQEGFANGNFYYYLHSGNRFAFVTTKNEIFVDPELLKNA